MKNICAINIQRQKGKRSESEGNHEEEPDFLVSSELSQRLS